jgi:hypothetical protein
MKELMKDEPTGAAKPVEPTRPVLVLIRALDYALDVVGRMGKELILSMLEDRHGIHAEDILTRPGQYLSPLRDILGDSYEVVERRMLQKVEEETGLRGSNLESTVELLRRSYR